MSLLDSSSGINFSSLVTLETDSSLSFVISTSQKSIAIDQLSFPQAMKTNYEKGFLVFNYRSGGVQIAQNDVSYPVKRMMVYDNIGLDMPWVGVYDAVKGDGMMVLANTPYDVEIDFSEDKGLIWPNVAWASSLRQFSYERKVSYVFTSGGNYVSLAKAYRNYLKQSGDFETLAQKAIVKPRVNWLKGSAVVWGSSGLKFAKEAKAMGIKTAIIMGSKFKKDEITQMTGLGFLNSSYENLEGTREGPIGHMKDTMAIAAYHTVEGKPIIGWVTKTGVEYYSRSSVRSLIAAPSYLPSYLKDVPLTGLFLDVTPAFLIEDFHPLHTFNREADKQYKNKIKEYIGKDLGLVLGGEHGKAWNSSILEYAEGTMTGSFFWDDGNKPGYLDPPKDTTYMSANFKKYGFNYRNRIPLWQLVFNDCVSSTWYWGDSSDWFYAITPTISDLKDNFNMLYGSMPLLWADKKGYGWDRNRSRFAQTIRNVSNFQKRVSFSELLSHEFLNEDHTLQQSKFAGGGQAFVNFGEKAIKHKIGKKNINIAPRGFYLTASGFLQSKTIDEQGVVTRIEADSLISVQTDQLRKVGPITTNGTVTIFRLDNGNWRIVVENTLTTSEIDVRAILKNKNLKFYTLLEVEEDGSEGKAFSKKLPVNMIKIPAVTGIKLFDIYLE
ncbi:glycoside hydrolase [Pedobacter jamesrossensis]|uniref:Glycoside hydrolase n=1 Tax=Pedobacter jamesrossensis TaxID=1908238 RepID=A0ABV8NN18_9SPHI